MLLMAMILTPPSGASGGLGDVLPRLAPWATVLRPLRGLEFRNSISAVETARPFKTSDEIAEFLHLSRREHISCIGFPETLNPAKKPHEPYRRYHEFAHQ
jgi:hypothetical protein